jgi:hypothetical protein
MRYTSALSELGLAVDAPAQLSVKNSHKPIFEREKMGFQFAGRTGMDISERSDSTTFSRNWNNAG